MAAKEVEQGSSHRQRQSVQEELTSFFADTASAEKAPSKVAVKGSILSFFKKASDASSVSKCPPDSNKPKPSVSTATKQLPGDVVEWVCETCTFQNSKPRKKYLKCEMCHSMYIQGDDTVDEPAPLVSPPPQKSTRTRHEREGRHSRRSNSMPKTAGSPVRQTQDVNVVVIDDDGEFASPSTLSNGKRKRPVPKDFVVIDIDGADANQVKRTNKKPCLETLPKDASRKELLLFKVSQNSGRITLHYADRDGMSSLVNIDIQDILTEDSVDALAEAQTKRSLTQSKSTSLDFEQEELDRGRRSNELLVSRPQQFPDICLFFSCWKTRPRHCWFEGEEEASLRRNQMFCVIVSLFARNRTKGYTSFRPGFLIERACAGGSQGHDASS